MGKSHRDNVKARKKAKLRGVDVYAKRDKRRNKNDKVKCNVCGVLARPIKIENGMCKMCRERC